ncbi:MAG: hypothetical protein SH868_17220 [Bythopirellula sp.]|nr:hypothetical protein [Bythopirellula sp.]
MMRLWQCLPLLLWSLQLGCDRGLQLGDVQGKVTFRGKSLDHGMVSFFPAKGRPIGVAILIDGTYMAALEAGDYEVIVVSPPKLPAGFKEGDPLPPPDPNPLPAKYGRKETSGLSARIEPGSEPQVVDFEME